MKKILLALPLCAAPMAALAENGASGPEPHEGILASVRAVRTNDMGGVLRAVLSDEQLSEMEAEWDRQRAEQPDPQSDAQFQMVMTMLTASGAEDMLMAQVEPKLQEMRPQVSMMVGMFSGMMQSALEQDQSLDLAEKQRTMRVMDAIGEVLLQNDLTSPESARKAIGIVCQSARDLKLRNMAEVQKLPFEELVSKGDVVMKGLKDLLAVYGLDVNEWLDSVEAETKSVSGDHAVVRVSYEILGIQESFDAEMTRVGSRWIRKEAAELTPAAR